MPSDAAPIEPDDLLRRTFTSVRRGYDPVEVQKYLMALASELRAGRERERALEGRVQAAEQRADELEEMAPSRLSSLVGEETARVLDAANAAATDIRTRAEENVARMLREAQDEATALRRDADTVLQRRTGEAEEAAAAIRRQADEVLQQARVDAEAEIEAGRQRGREMVVEAQRVRERMLRDLARRRKLLRQQIEQLQAGRGRLMAAYDVVRETLDTATEELRVAVPEAKLAAEAAALRAAEDEVGEATFEQELAALSAQADAAAADAAAADAPAADEPAADEPAADELVADESAADEAVADGPVADGPASDEPASDAAVADESVVEASEPDEAIVDEPAMDENVAGEPTTDEVAAEAADEQTPDTADAAGAAMPAVLAPDAAPGDPGVDESKVDEPEVDEPEVDEPVADEAVADETEKAPDPPEGRHSSAVKVVRDPASGPALEPTVADGAEQAGREDGDGSSPSAKVAGLFARMKEESGLGDGDPALDVMASADATVDGSALPDEVVADTDPVADVDAVEDPDQRARARRDDAVEPLVRQIGRKVKRELSDEQNELLDGVRRQDTDLQVDDLLPAPEAHVERFSAAVHAGLVAAAEAGATSVGAAPATPSAALRELGAEFAAELVAPLRDRIGRAFAEAGDDPDDLAERLRACYREWRTQRVDGFADHTVVGAYNRGVLDAVEAGTALRWLVDDGESPSPDCEDNALAGATVTGEAFPTGHLAPPAHPSCRCLLVIATASAGSTVPSTPATA